VFTARSAEREIALLIAMDEKEVLGAMAMEASR
jgi:hypothetical protein